MFIRLLQRCFSKLSTFRENRFHPLVWIVGSPIVGKNVYIGAFSLINANGSSVEIGDNCDVASFVSINCADSHLRCIGLASEISRGDIKIGNNVFIGAHSIIKGGVVIGSNTVVGAGTVVDKGYIPPYSLVVGNPMVVKAGYYKK